jgi:hypothetical protein
MKETNKCSSIYKRIVCKKSKGHNSTIKILIENAHMCTMAFDDKASMKHLS